MKGNERQRNKKTRKHENPEDSDLAVLELGEKTEN
jgi:hypothetical protein